MDTDPRDQNTPRIAATAGGRYEVVRAIGQGGMAQVFLCVHRGPGGFEKRLVMKVLRSKFVGDDEYIRMFLDEARLLSRIQHPNIVDVFEVDCVDGLPYLLMAYVNGPTLGKLHQRAIRMGLFDLGCFLHIVLQVCQALDYAHSLEIDREPAGIVHRDVSSQNILIDGQSGIVKLIDFGIAKTAQDEAETDSRIVKGKLTYMAPEVLRGMRADARADLYAVGVTLYRIVTNRRPGEGRDGRSGPVTGLPPRASELADWISPELDEIIDRALQPDPDDRYQSAAELVQDLQAEIDRYGTHPTRLAEWLRDVYPGGERDWAEVLDEATLGGGPVHPSLGRLVSRGNGLHEAPIRVPARRKSGPAAAIGILVALVVLLGFGVLAGGATIAVLWQADPVAADPIPTYLAAADELLAEREVEAARVMNRMAEERGTADPVLLAQIVRQRAAIEREAAHLPSPAVTAAAVEAPNTPARLPPTRRPVRLPSSGEVPDPPPPVEVATAVVEEPAPVEPEAVVVPEPVVPEAVPVPEPVVAPTSLVGRVGGASRDGGHHKVVGDIKVFDQVELKVKSRTNLSYPQAARRANLGDHRCVVQVFIDERGAPYDVLVEGCPRAFFEETRTAILDWRWYPPKDGDMPCKALTTINVNYRQGS